MDVVCSGKYVCCVLLCMRVSMCVVRLWGLAEWCVWGVHVCGLWCVCGLKYVSDRETYSIPRLPNEVIIGVTFPDKTLLEVKFSHYPFPAILGLCSKESTAGRGG